MRNRVNTPSVLTFEQEELWFGTDVIRPAAFGDFRHQFLQHAAWVTFKWLAIRREDIAEDARPASFQRGPGKNGIRLRIEPQMHVALLNTREPFHRRAIEPYAVFERAIQSAQWHVNTFHRAGHIRELQ